MNTRDTIATMRKKTIVTAPMGSWKWQRAYRKATYKAAEGVDSRILWKSVG